jgi:hypothetical protein
MSRRALVLGAVAGVAILVLVAVTGLGWWSGAPAGGAPSSALEVRTSFEPNPSFFGDPVVAQVAVQRDTRVVAARSLRVDASFAPYVETAPPAVSRSRAGSAETTLYRYTIQCVTDGCLPLGKPRTVQFPPVVVTASAGTRSVKATGRWAPMLVTSRLTAADVAASAGRFRRPATMPRPVYAVSPGPLAGALTAAAVILALAALALLGVELTRLAARRRRDRAAELTQLEVALAYVREAASRDDAADRRKAVGLLAETLAVEGRGGLAASADDVAWSEVPPSQARTLRLADEVEQTESSGPA